MNWKRTLSAAAPALKRVALAVFVAGAGFAASAQTLTAEQTQFFEQKIRPVLVKQCYECHSQEANKSKGGLFVDTREGLLKGGDTGPAIVPGDVKLSKLISAIKHETDELQMPPEGKLSAQEIADFEQWVKSGAHDPRTGGPALATKNLKDHWAFKPVVRPALPKVKHAKWATNPIDHLVLADLEARKLEPSKPADRTTLLRRLTFDLTGLPPSPAEVESFVKDSSDDSLEKLIDRLLASPRFGERWARHWLDVARYADSNGLENNAPFANAWRYRDYVVSSFNEDKPLNRMVREQVAGDLIQSKTDEEYYTNLIASGFLMLGPKPVGVNPEQQELDIADEQIDVTTKAFLGLTVSCARCHDHKFDPIPTRDYYALAGIFLSTRTLGNQQNGPFATVSERPLASREVAKKIEDHDKMIADAQAELTRMQEVRRNLPGGVDSKKLDGIVIDNKDAEVVGNWKASNYATNFVDADYLQDGNADKGKNLVRFRPEIPAAGFYEVRIAYQPRPNRATNVPVVIEGSKGTRKILVNQRLETTYDKAFVSLGDFEFAPGTNGTVTISNEGTKGFVVIDAVQFIPADAMLAASMRRGGSEANMMMQTFNSVPGEISPEELRINQRIRDLRAQAPAPLPTAMAPAEGTIRNASIRIRGDVQRVGDSVPRGVLTALGGADLPMPKFTPESSGRLELAEWIAHDKNPLTARVYVNRIWSKLMGRGLVETPDNFGIMGEKPSHPELLDELAAQFIADGWSTKKLIRRIVLSNVYQQSSESDSRWHVKDPDNRFYWRANRKRLEPEAIRDAMMMVSARLQFEPMGGAPTNLNINPVGLTAVPEFIGIPRRSIYLPVVRNNVPDFFQALDFPDPHTVNGKRHITVAAPQALLFMNSPFVIEEAKAWAQALKDASKNDELARRVYLHAYGRYASDAEVKRAAGFCQAQETTLTKAGDKEPRNKALQALCHAIFASSEFRVLN